MPKEKHIIKHEDGIEFRPKIYVPKKMPAENRTIGEVAADKLTSFAGSWTFITILFMFIAAWIWLNLTAYVNNWDPWPFIILNLCLSTLAAIQAPIILMSQNRSEQKDRIRQEYDYAADRKSLHQINKVYKELVYLRSDLNHLKKKKRKR